MKATSTALRRPALALCGLLALAAPLAAAGGHEHHTQEHPVAAAEASCHGAPAAAPAEPAAQAERDGSFRIPDLEVVDQDGRTVHFYRDLVAGKVVAMNFVFTTCTTVCPPMGATFSRLERQLAEAGREDVALISVSIDPTVDTPQRLKAWGENFQAGERWTLVTGAKSQIDRLLKGLGVFTAEKTEHSPVAILGNDATGEWKRVHGLASPTQMAAELAALADGASKAAASPAAGGEASGR